MSRKQTLRKSAKLAEMDPTDKDVDIDVDDIANVIDSSRVDDASPSPAPAATPVSSVEDCNAMYAMNMDLCEKLVEKFGNRVMKDIGAIVEGLKSDLLEEIRKRDVMIQERDVKCHELENEVISLRDAMAISASKTLP